MARILNVPKWTGTRRGLTVYQVNGKFYVRCKSSLSGKRVRTSAAFANTRQHAQKLVTASKLASKIYAELPDEFHIFRNYRVIVGRVMKLRKNGWKEKVIIECLLDPADMEKLFSRRPD